MAETTIPTTPNGMAQYTIEKDGNNQEYKVVNFDNPEMVPNKGIKIIRAIKGSSRHQPALVTRLERDKITGIIYGIPAGLNEITKDLRFQPIEINDMVQYDLSIREDRMRWAVIGRAKFLANTIWSKGKPTHTIYDVDAEAVAKVVTINERKQAYATMDGLSALQVVDMARNCGGINVVNNSQTIIISELYDFIDSKELNKGAKKFNEIWKMSNREAMTIFKRCQSVGLVSFDVNSGFVWKLATVLGQTEPQAIDNISQNHALLMAMDNESRSMDPSFVANATDEEKTKYITAMPLPKNVDDDILKKMAARMEKMEIESAKKNETLELLLAKLEAKDHVNLSAEINVSEVNAPVLKAADPELDDLRKAAKAMGMAHAYLPASTKEKVIEWIEKNKK